MQLEQAYLTNPDKLGLGLRAAAQQRRAGNFAASGNMRDLDANFMDPQWDSFLESLHNRGVNRVGIESTQAFAPLSPGNHISTAALDGFARAANLPTGRPAAASAPMPESHEDFMARMQRQGVVGKPGQSLLKVNNQRGGTAAM